jgi:tetratricopeptide (TPR) repeat protein
MTVTSGNYVIMSIFSRVIRSICYLSFYFASFAYAQFNKTELEIHTQQIEKYYEADIATVSFDDVIQIATKIVPNRTLYDPNTLAKTYSLLAQIAYIKGESSRSYQLTLFGLTYQPISPEVALNLKLRLVAGYFFNNQYEEILEVIEGVIISAEQENNSEYRIQALGYRAMAKALLGLYDESQADLISVEQVINSNQSFANYDKLYEILAIAQHYLGNDEASLSLYEKVLNQRFKMDNLLGIETTYFLLGEVYLSMGRLDDAYNAFWEAQKFAREFQLPIKEAYADFGLGKVLIQQQRYEPAFKALVEAENSFKGRSLNGPYLSTLIELIVASQKTQRIGFANQLLKQADEIIQTNNVRPNQAKLYQLLATYYQQLGDYKSALSMLKKYVDTQSNSIQEKVNSKENINRNPVTQSQIQTLKVAEMSESKSNLNEQVAKKSQVIFLLLVTCFLFFAIIILQWLNMRAQRLKYAYEQDERPAHELSQPYETKRIFHAAFKMARKYEYPISVGYIEVSNWSDLTFQYNKKVVGEVSKTIAIIINENLGEFDSAGQINDGQYLIIYPHQKNDESLRKMDKIVDALKVRFFANLGEFSVNIVFSLDAPNVQDIDPYIFLSRLIEK